MAGQEKKEESCRKSPWRFVFAAMAVYGAVKLLPGIWVNVVYWVARVVYGIRHSFHPEEAYSVGIIGGADGPTAIFVTAPLWASYAVPAMLLIVGIAGYLRFSRCSQS